MIKRSRMVFAVAGVLVGLLDVDSAQAIPAFARQYDMQCNACHTRPPRLNRFGEAFHMMGFQIPSASRPRGIVQAFEEDGPAKVLLDSVALRIEGGLIESVRAGGKTETSLAPPDEMTLFVSRPILPDLTFFVEIEGKPNEVVFENGRFRTEGSVGVGKEAFFMWNMGRLFGLVGAPTMEMGGLTMVGRHGGFTMHGPMMMAGKVDPSTNFSYPTNRQIILETETEVERGEVERFPIVPYAFTSKFFGVFKDRAEREPQLVTDQVMYNTPGAPGSDFHAMFNDVFLAQVGFLRENEGFNIYGAGRFDLLDRDGLTFNVSALVNWGFGLVRSPDPDDHDRPGDRRLDRLRYGVAANARWQGWDVYGALIFDHLFGFPGGIRGDFDRTAAGLTAQVDYLVHETVLLSTRFDQLWAGGLRDEKRDGSVITLQLRYYPWPNIAFFIRDSVNLRREIEEHPLRNWRNQIFAGVDWAF